MSDFRTLSGKRVFVTGAASGIGYELALAFAREGADILAADIQAEGLQSLQRGVGELGRECQPLALDVTDVAAYEKLVAKLAAGGRLPDIVVNNAGIGYLAGFLDTDSDMWRRTLDINVLGVVNGCRAFLPALVGAGKPALLVNVASLASIAPVPNMSAYAASKYAVEGFTEVLAMELLDTPVRAMCIHPGVINTGIVGNPAMAKVPDEQLQRLHAYYRARGAHPATVARDVVAGVKAGRTTVLTGPGVGLVGLLKRLLPRRAFRRVLLGNARKIGYL